MMVVLREQWLAERSTAMHETPVPTERAAQMCHGTVQRRRLWKIIGVVLMIVGCVGAGFLLLPLLLLVICPMLGSLLALSAAAALCFRSRHPWVESLFGHSTRIFLWAATVNAVCATLGVIASMITEDEPLPNEVWIWLGVFFVPQLLWIRQLRANPLAALFVALALVVPAIEIWREFGDRQNS